MLLGSIKNGDKIWQILNEDEKIALTLQLVEGKSTWQAGEIMGKSHYKYLEIFDRAREYIKTFKPFFAKYNRVCPKTLGIPNELKAYFTYLITKRSRLQEATEKTLKGTKFAKGAYRTHQIELAFEKLKHSPYEVDQVWLNTILHFDKWNNFRILPKSVREPSAFKRRNTFGIKKHLESYLTLPEYAVDRLIKKIDNSELSKRFHGYILRSRNNQLVPEKIYFPDKSSIIELVNALGIYYFNKEAEADLFIELALAYSRTYSTPKEGLRFWPKYRALTRLAANYLDQQNIIPDRAYLQNLSLTTDDLKASLDLRDELKPKPKK